MHVTSATAYRDLLLDAAVTAESSIKTDMARTGYKRPLDTAVSALSAGLEPQSCSAGAARHRPTHNHNLTRLQLALAAHTAAAHSRPRPLALCPLTCSPQSGP